MLEGYDRGLFREETWSEKWKRVFDGLKASRDSGEYKFARMEIDRVVYPSSVSTTTTILLLLLAVLLKMDADVPDPQLDVNLVEPEVTELDKVIEEPIVEPPPEEVVNMEPSSEMANSPVDQIVSQAPSFGDDSSDDLVPVVAVDVATVSPMILKGLYGARTGGGRASAIGRHGGGGSDTVVLRALRWLKANQQENGSWEGSGSPTAMCGLALLCYMAHGETPASKDFGETVEKAIRYLLYAQDANGRFSGAGANYVYGHAIATYALAESFGMTKMHMLKEPMERAVKVIVDGQQPGGAFDYNYAKGERRDMSVTAWQVQALKAAKMAGSETVGLQECLYKCVDGLKSFVGGDGTFGYAGAGGSPVLTGAGILGLQFLDKAADPAVANAFVATRDLVPSWPAGAGGTYAWYYHTQARFQNGGALWDSWNKVMLPMLTQNQIVEGNKGHWDSQSTHSASLVYDTTLCCLCLEVYYRYLPTYDKADDPKKAPKTNEEKDAKIAVDLVM